MPFEVLLTDDAVRDLEEVYGYVAENDSPKKVLKKFEAVFIKLSESPHRGSRPKELTALGIQEYRQVMYKPYRIIYRVIEANVYIYLIADGRRDMQSLLQRRLLQS